MRTAAPCRSNGGRWYGAVVLGALAAIAVLLWSLSPAGAWSWLLPERVHVQIDDAAYRVTESRWQQAYERSMAVLNERQQAALPAMEAEVKAQVAAAFALPRDKVTDAADWYFSARGQAVRARITMRGWVGRDGRSSARKAAAVGRRLFPDSDWAQVSTRLIEQLMQRAAGHSQDALDGMRSALHAELAGYQVDAGDNAGIPLVVLDFDTSTVPDIAADGSALMPRGSDMSNELGTALAARRATQSAVLRTAGRGGSLVCGGVERFPRACEAGVFTVTQVGAELLVLFLDEQFNRPALEAAFRDDLDRLERELRDALLAIFVDGLADDFAARQAAIDAAAHGGLGSM